MADLKLFENEMVNLQDLAPSKLQHLVSELFRLQLCRNDDHNLAQSTLMKGIAVMR